MQYEFIGKHLVCLDTGEIVEPSYTVVNPSVSAEDKRYYAATKLTAHDCVDTDQLADVMKYTVDQRGLKVQSQLTELKKESDYGVRTLKNKATMSNPQYNFLKQLVECITYKNIILCKRSFLCKKLGVLDNHLNRKLASVSCWVQQKEARKGYIKLFLHPMVGYKGRAIGISSAYHAFYTVDKETQYNALYVPFVGPIPAYTGPVIDFTKPPVGATQYSDSRLEFFDSAEDFTSGDWWDKPAKENEVIDVEFEVKFVGEYYAKLA